APGGERPQAGMVLAADRRLARSEQAGGPQEARERLMFERFTDSARQCVAGAQEESFHLDSGYIGTEHLLISLAAEPQGLGGHVLRELGATAEALREDAKRIEPGAIDPDALATLGIDLEEVRRRVEETFGPGALSRGRAGCGDRLPFSRKAKK